MLQIEFSTTVTLFSPWRGNKRVFFLPKFERNTYTLFLFLSQTQRNTWKMHSDALIKQVSDSPSGVCVTTCTPNACYASLHPCLIYCLCLCLVKADLSPSVSQWCLYNSKRRRIYTDRAECAEICGTDEKFKKKNLSLAVFCKSGQVQREKNVTQTWQLLVVLDAKAKM